MDIRIATCPCSWGVWNPDGGPAYVPHETFLQQASECGYQEIELGPDGYLPMESDTLKSELRKYQLNVCAGTATIPFYSLEKEECRAIVTPLAQRLKALGVSDMVVMTVLCSVMIRSASLIGIKRKCRVSTIKF